MRENTTALVFLFDSVLRDHDHPYGRLNVCIPRTREGAVFRDKQWAHVVHHQAPLVAAVELFLGGFDVSAGLLSLSPECMHASLRKAATTPSVTEATMQAQVPTDEDSIVKVVSQLFPFARGTDGDRDVAVAERVLGEKKRLMRS